MTLIVTAPGFLHTERDDEEAEAEHGAGRAGYAMTILRIDAWSLHDAPATILQAE